MTLFRSLVVAAALLAAGFTLADLTLAALRGGGPESARTLGRLGASLAAGVVAAGAIALGVTRHRPAVANGWWCLGGGVLAVSMSRTMVGQVDVVPTAVLLVGHALLAGGAVLLVVVRQGRADREGLIDAAILAAALTRIFWEFLVGPRVPASASLPAGAALLLQLTLVTVAMRLLRHVGRRLPSAWLLLGGGALGLVATLAAPPSVAGLRLVADAAWFAAAACLAGAALHPSMRDVLGDPRPAPARLTGARLSLLAAALLVGPSSTLFGQATGFSRYALVGPMVTVLITALVVWRIALVFQQRDRAADEAAAAARFNRAVLDALPARTAVLDGRGVIVASNAAWHSGGEHGLGDPWCRPGDTDYLAACRHAAVEDGSTSAGAVAAGIAQVLERSRPHFQLEYDQRGPDGESRSYVLRVTPLKLPGEDDEAGRGRAVISHQDITWRKRAEEDLRALAEEQAAVAALGHSALSDLELDVLFEQAVSIATEVLGVELTAVMELQPRGDALLFRAGSGWPSGWVGNALMSLDVKLQGGYSLRERVPVVFSDIAEEDRFALHPMVAERNVVSGVSVVIEGWSQPFGIFAVYSCRKRTFTRGDVNFLQAIANVLGGAIGQDRSEQAIRHQALHDPLTDLPNRTLLLDRLRHALARAERDHGDVAVLFIDVDNFKSINDSLGHDAGDQLLVALVPRLRQLLRPADTIARFAGDEFVIVCEDVGGEDAAQLIAKRITTSLEEPFRLADGEVVVSASIGIALGRGTRDADALLRSADAAMYQAKQGGRSRHAMFDEQMRARALRRLRIEHDLRDAVERDELSVVYQPVVALRDSVTADGGGEDRIEGVETLLRWQHPELGAITPDEFIPVAEDSGLIVPIGEWVLRQACNQVAAWRRDYPGATPFTTYVNLSARQLADPDLADTVAALLSESGAAADQIGVEVTESQVFTDTDATLRTLDRLKGLGLRIAMDDFGTGYSSLSYLKRLPVDVVKVDRSFVDGLGSDPEDSAIVEAVVRMAGALRLQVTAEGVETGEQLDALRELGCDLAQGFYLSRPGSPDSIEPLLSRYSASR